MTVVEGTRFGRVNGLAVTGNDAGSVLPIMAEVTPAQGESGQIIATGIPAGGRSRGSKTRNR